MERSTSSDQGWHWLLGEALADRLMLLIKTLVAREFVTDRKMARRKWLVFVWRTYMVFVFFVDKRWSLFVLSRLENRLTKKE